MIVGLISDTHGLVRQEALDALGGPTTSSTPATSAAPVCWRSCHIAARVSALAGAGEVIVSRTVKDLTAGSGLTFQPRGVHTLKGVPDEWQVYAVD